MLCKQEDFPILNREVRGKTLVYLDNAATTQKPQAVIEAEANYYRTINANVHRGIHTLAEEATKAYEDVREKVRSLISAGSTKEIVFTRGTTESINLVAYTWARQNLKAGDEIIVSIINHHSNIVPWQMLAKERGVGLVWNNSVGPIHESAVQEEWKKILSSGKVKLVALTHASNTLGVIYDVKPLIKICHEAGALVLLDGAQSVPHAKVDMRDLDCDFFAFSSHKMCGPTGVGVLYAKEALLEIMTPFHGGGEMIKAVTKEDFIANDLPWKFEAGTPNIGGVVTFGAAIDYLQGLGWDKIKEHEQELIKYALEQLKQIDKLKIIGPETAEDKIGLVAFTIEGLHPHDIASELDKAGIAVRAGHHCTQPLHTHLGLNGSTRASFYIYNTKEEIDAMVASIKECIKVYS
ncbi:MAG: cysteine desulfurase [Candidatus Komeilibacteria bacterium]